MYDLPTFLDYWESVRKRTKRVAACIPEDKMEWAPAAGRWSCGDILRHLAPHFTSPRVGGVTGNPRVANRSKLLGRLQAIEFTSIGYCAAPMPGSPA